jgi:hypothetical protein
VLVGFAAVALGLFALLHAKTLNMWNDIDPWIYTGLFKNWDYMYRVFGDTYYPTRLPYLIPGYFVNQLLPPVPAFYVLHWGYLVLGATFAFLLVRHFYGRMIGAIVYAATLVNVLYFGSHIDDYYDGAVIAYLFAGLYFVLTARDSGRYRLKMAAGGFFLWGAATTNLFAGIPVACIALIYACVYWPTLRRNLGATLLADSTLLIAGAAAMTIACGVFSVIKGGQFFYFMNQIRVLGTLDLSTYKIHGYAWLKHEPKLLIPFFLLLVIAILTRRRLLARWSTDPAARLAVGSAAYLALLFAVLAFWEFAAGGIFLEIPYYFSYVITGFVLCLGAAIWVALRSGSDTEDIPVRPGVVVGVAAVVAALPAVLVSRGVPSWRFFTTQHGSTISVVLLIVGAIAAISLRALPRAALALGSTVLLLVLGVNFASAAGVSGYLDFQTTTTTRTESRHALDLGVDFISFMKRSGVQKADRPPAFWYDGNSDPMMGAMQSLYLWQSTWIGLRMPTFGADERRILKSRRPPDIVLLCVNPNCSGGASVLRKAGFELRPVASAFLTSGPHRIWVRAYRLPIFAKKPTVKNYFTLIDAPLVQPPTGTSVATWTFARGLPSTFQSQAGAVSRTRGGLAVTTTKGRFAYQLESTAQVLQPGTYTVALKGKVLTGGLTLGILDANADKWIVQSSHASIERGFDTKVMAATFSLTQPTNVQIILTNSGPHDLISTWRLDSVDVLRTK